MDLFISAVLICLEGFVNRFAIQPEIRYSTMGGNSNDFKLGLSYLTVPVMFQFYPSANFYIEAGPVMALNTSHTPNTTVINNKQYLVSCDALPSTACYYLD